MRLPPVDGAAPSVVVVGVGAGRGRVATPWGRRQLDAFSGTSETWKPVGLHVGSGGSCYNTGIHSLGGKVVDIQTNQNMY